MRRFLLLCWWAVGYLSFLLSFAYLIGFVGNRYTFSTIDSGLQIPFAEAFVRDCFLLLLFFAQHSLMARAWFHRGWRRLLPEEAERPAYLLATSAALVLIYARWEPMPEMVWEFENLLIRRLFHAVFWAGWALVFWASFRIGHWDQFGLKQVLSGSYAAPEFRTPGPYAWVRHPTMLGLLLAFWATPEMSRGHLLFAAANTLYVLVALRWEERDLCRLHGRRYADYREEVPQLCPVRFRRRG